MARTRSPRSAQTRSSLTTKTRRTPGNSPADQHVEAVEPAASTTIVETVPPARTLSVPARAPPSPSSVIRAIAVSHLSSSDPERTQDTAMIARWATGKPDR
jgi:hypothetical protein